MASFDVKDLARRLHEVGAGYYCITVMQGTRHMLAPNATYDAVCGTKPGEACATRDLIWELSDALAKYDIDLCLYYTGDGPHADPVCGSAFGFVDPRGNVTEEFVRKWASVLREYAVRYGSRVKAWIIDGCYRKYFGYTDELMSLLYDACKAGNPDCLVAMNDGLEAGFGKNYPGEELTFGEFNDFTDFAPARFIDGAQAHILAPLGIDDQDCCRWCRKGARLDGKYMLDYVKKANARGMVVSIDTFVDYDGSWDPEQTAVLKYIGDHL